MAKLSQKNRDRLLKIHSDERSEERCLLVRKYTKEADELSKANESMITMKQGEINVSISRINGLKNDKERLIKDRDELLKEHNLLNFNTSYGTCNLGGKPVELEEFDLESRRMEKEILER